eukprot:scaffold2466_cov333-Pavlova_lutheri.AAC.9
MPHPRRGERNAHVCPRPRPSPTLPPPIDRIGGGEGKRSPPPDLHPTRRIDSALRATTNFRDVHPSRRGRSSPNGLRPDEEISRINHRYLSRRHRSQTQEIGERHRTDRAGWSLNLLQTSAPRSEDTRVHEARHCFDERRTNVAVD